MEDSGEGAAAAVGSGPARSSSSTSRAAAGGRGPASSATEPDAERREEFAEEDDDGQPLVAEGEVGANLKVWARTLERPSKGNIKSFSEGLWRPDKQLCRIIKARGKDLKAMGFAFEGDIHLFPEETLFLVERCKLEVGNVTTAQLYESVDSLQHYLVYSYFKQTTLIVFRVEPGCRPPVPPGVAFVAYAPCSQFAKKNPGTPLFYVMFGGTRAPVPTGEELSAIFAWARGVPIKYAMVSDEGGVFAVDLSPRPLENHTHLAEVAEAKRAAAAANGGYISNRARKDQQWLWNRQQQQQQQQQQQGGAQQQQQGGPQQQAEPAQPPEEQPQEQQQGEKTEKGAEAVPVVAPAEAAQAEEVEEGEPTPRKKRVKREVIKVEEAAATAPRRYSLRRRPQQDEAPQEREPQAPPAAPTGGRVTRSGARRQPQQQQRQEEPPAAVPAGRYPLRRRQPQSQQSRQEQEQPQPAVTGQESGQGRYHLRSRGAKGPGKG